MQLTINFLNQNTPRHIVLYVPGDKSIGHRLLMLSLLSTQPGEIKNLSLGEDITSTLACLQKLGLEYEVVQEQDTFGNISRRVIWKARPNNYWKQLREQSQQCAFNLDAQNSGTTFRILSGLLCGLGICFTMDGDDSLRARPMGRIVEPLKKMGVVIEPLGVGANNHEFYAPLKFVPAVPLKAIEYKMTVASAQVKSCLLMAGLFAEGETLICESIPTRNHTENILLHLKQPLKIESSAQQTHITLVGAELKKFTLNERLFTTVPGDPSSAAFWIVWALLNPNFSLTLPGILFNPTRIYFIPKILETGTGRLKQKPGPLIWGEVVGELQVLKSPHQEELQALKISDREVPSLVDEIPILSLLMATLNGTSEVRGAAELRSKESDRIAGICHMFQLLGLPYQEFNDGFSVQGDSQIFAKANIPDAALNSLKDHRLAMTYAILGLFLKKGLRLENAESASVSYPQFYQELDRLQQF